MARFTERLKEVMDEQTKSIEENPTQAGKDFITSFLKYFSIFMILLFLVSRPIYYQVGDTQYSVEESKTKMKAHLQNLYDQGYTNITVTDGFSAHRWIEIESYNIFD